MSLHPPPPPLQDLIKHAQFQTTEKECTLKLSRNVQFSDFVVPNRKTLTVTLAQSIGKQAASAAAGEPAAGGQPRHDPFPRNSCRIARFHEKAVVMHSKVRWLLVESK